MASSSPLFKGKEKKKKTGSARLAWIPFRPSLGERGNKSNSADLHGGIDKFEILSLPHRQANKRRGKGENDRIVWGDPSFDDGLSRGEEKRTRLPRSKGGLGTSFGAVITGS